MNFVKSNYRATLTNEHLGEITDAILSGVLETNISKKNSMLINSMLVVFQLL